MSKNNSKTTLELKAKDLNLEEAFPLKPKETQNTSSTLLNSLGFAFLISMLSPLVTKGPMITHGAHIYVFILQLLSL